MQVAIHTDTLNEAGFVEDTIAAINGRTIHTYHTEGAGGGHAPDIIRLCGEPNVLPSSTNPTMPFTRNTLDEHLDMLMVCHHLSPKVPEDVAFADSRIRPETIAAEDVLHDLGAISMMSSDSQAMGRIGEVICRTWQTADKMKRQRGPLPATRAPTTTMRVRRYIAKYTINPAITHGIATEVGSIEVGKLADLVLWKPAFFGVKPELIIKGGFIAGAMMGDGNASIPTPQPVIARSMFGGFGAALDACSVHFVSQAGHRRRRARRSVAAVGWRSAAAAAIGKRDLVLNDALPQDRGERRHLRGARRRRAADLRAGRRAAARAAVFPVLRPMLQVVQVAAGRCATVRRADAAARCGRARYARDTITLGWEDRLKSARPPPVGRRRRVRHDAAARHRAARRRLLRPRRAGDVVVAWSSAPEPVFVIEPRDAGRVGAVRVSHRQQPSAADARPDDAIVCPDVPGMEQVLDVSRHPVRPRDPAVHARRPDVAGSPASAVEPMTGSLAARCCTSATACFPIGAFAHSDGLEAATDRGRVATADDLRRWMDASLGRGARAHATVPAVASPGRRSRRATADALSRARRRAARAAAVVGGAAGQPRDGDAAAEDLAADLRPAADRLQMLRRPSTPTGR